MGFLTRPASQPVVRIERDGVAWALNGHDLNEFRIAVEPSHSPALINALNREIVARKAKTFWDIGANIGGVSLPLLHQNSGLSAIMFEPSAEVAGRLIRNLSMNPALTERARVLNLALSDNTGIANFYVSNESQNSGVAGLGHSANRFSFPVSVQAVRGDELVQAGVCPPPDLIKIDVEGFEIEVLQGLESTLRQYKPPVIFEHSIYRLRERKLPEDQIATFLRSLGYEIYMLESGKIVTANDLHSDADFIARPAS